MLYPFWGKNPEDPADPNSGRFDRYAASGAALFKLAPLDDATLAGFSHSTAACSPWLEVGSALH